MDKAKLTAFINDNISSFHQSRLAGLSKLKLSAVLKRKNPYLFKAKNIQTAGALVTTLVDAFLSSQEETLFGEFLEKLAIYASEETRGGFKSGITGIDLEIIEGNTRYIVSIKSGPHWGNSTQIDKLKDIFVRAQKTLHTQNSGLHIVPINGCCYGKCTKPDKGHYIKYCGQQFWEFITKDKNFYLEIVEPLGYKAKEKNEIFYQEYAKIINKFTREFLENYSLPDGDVDWEKIVKMNSEMVHAKSKSTTAASGKNSL